MNSVVRQQGDRAAGGTLWLNEGFAACLSGLLHSTWPRMARIRSPRSPASRRQRLRAGHAGAAPLQQPPDHHQADHGPAPIQRRTSPARPRPHFGTARRDLQAHLEATSGLDLTIPVIGSAKAAQLPAGVVAGQGADLNAQLDQTTSHLSVDFFALPVPVLFKNGQQDSLVVLDHTFSGQTFRFPWPSRADSALLDPRLVVIRANDLVLRVPDAAFGGGQALLVPNPVATRPNCSQAPACRACPPCVCWTHPAASCASSRWSSQAAGPPSARPTWPRAATLHGTGGRHGNRCACGW